MPENFKNTFSRYQLTRKVHPVSRVLHAFCPKERPFSNQLRFELGHTSFFHVAYIFGSNLDYTLYSALVQIIKYSNGLIFMSRMITLIF